jgi:survival-of-motor-neuron-related-splicing factor 30
MDPNDEHAANLKNYEIQLQQVLVALASNPEDEELLKLKTDLEEVIALTKELMTPLNPTLGQGQPSQNSSQSSSHSYKGGDKVLAPWSVDGLYYEARIDDVTSDGQCTVFFSSTVLPESVKKGVSEVCLTSLLKPLNQHKKNRWDQPSSSSSSVFKDTSKNNDKKATLSKEALKKKRDKRQNKLKELDEEREKDKMKWQSFALKKSSKKKGLTNTALGSKTRVSIFASPDSVDGRVGVGTCGISGKPMTPYVNTNTVASSSLSVPHKKKALSSGFPSSSS